MRTPSSTPFNSLFPLDPSHRVVNNALFMAGTEMREIKELDHETLRQHNSKIHGFYGRTDGWVPIDHYEEMKEMLPTSLCLDSSSYF